MPIQPIDLQNLFMRMNQIGKEQAEAKDIALQHQVVKNSEYAKEIEHRDRSVNESEELDEGSEKIKRREEHAGQGEQEKGGKKKEAGEKTEEKKPAPETLKESYLGHHIDITG